MEENEKRKIDTIYLCYNNFTHKNRKKDNHE